MRSVRSLLFASALLLSLQATASADCGGAQPLFSAGFESTQELTLSGSVVGLHQGIMEVRAGSTLISSTALGYGGVYEVALPPLAPEAMLSLRVRGTDEWQFLELASHVGSAGHLDRLARAEGGLAGEWAHAALVVTPESTVNYALVSAVAGEQAGPDCRLAEHQAALDPAGVTTRLAWLKIAMQHGGFGVAAATRAKTGGGTTLDLLLDDTALQQELERVEDEHPGLLGEYETLIQTPFCDYFQDERRIVLRDRELDLSVIYAAHIAFDTATTGLFVDTSFNDTFSFDCVGEVARLEFSGVTPVESWGFVDGVQTRVWRYEDFVEYRALDVGLEQVALVQTTQGRMHYPDLPDRPDLIIGGTSYRSALIRQAAGAAFDPASEPGEYSLPLHGFGQDANVFRTWLNADGSGSLLDSGQSLAWSVAADGSLTVELDDRTVHLLPFRNDGPVRDVFVTVDFPDGRRQVDAQLAYRRDPAAAITQSELPMLLRQHGERNDPDYPTFEFDLKADTTATSSQGRVFGWVLEGGRLTLRGCASPQMPLYEEPGWGQCSNYERRVFDVYQRDGNFWYLREERDTWYDFYGDGLELSITQRLNRPYGRLPPSP